MRRGIRRPSTAGAVSRKYGILPRIWRPKTSVYRKKRQELAMLSEETNDDCLYDNIPDEAYDSDSTLCDSENGLHREPSLRKCSIPSASSVLSSTIGSDEDLVFEGYTPHDSDMKSEIDGFSFDTEGCHFGVVPMQYAAKRLETKEPDECHCLSNMLHFESDPFGPWKTSCSHKNNDQKGQRDQPSSNAKHCHASSLYKRIYGHSSKCPISYPFCHFENRSKYIQQYKELCSSVGTFKKAMECKRQNKLAASLPYPYTSRLKSTACSIADNFDIFAILAIEKNASEKEMFENNGDLTKSLTVSDRGKNLNLAPVRDSPPLEFSTHQIQGKVLNKNQMPFNQYLNLVIPKTTLHRTNIQLNLDNPKDCWTPRFESKRNPAKQPHRRSESVDSQKRSLKTGTESGSRRSSGGNRASELRLERATTSAEGTRVKKESGYLIPPPPTLPQNSSILTKRKTQSQKTKCVNQIRAMLSDLDDCKGRLDRTYRRLENIKYSTETKHDRVIPATKPFGIEGQTCRTEDQLSIIHRLRKEKERTMRVSAVN